MRRVMRWFGKGRAVGLVLLAIFLVLRVGDPNFVSGLRNAAFDIYQQVSPRDYQPLPVAIIDIDDPSIAELGQWPWPRTVIARMVENATAAGAVVIGMDVIFSEPDRLSPDRVLAAYPELTEEMRAEMAGLPSNDEVLARAMAQSRVVVGQTSVRSGRSALATDTPPDPAAHAVLGADPAPFLPKFPDLLENIPELEAAAAGRGVFTTRPDADGIYRRIPMVMQVDGVVRLGLAPEVLRVATGGEAFAIRTNAAGIDGVVVGGQLVRTAPDGTVWPHFSPHVPARFVSAADVIADRVPEGRLNGHLVLVGTSAIGLEDFRPVPLGLSMAGVEIHAQVLENILAGTMLSRPNYAIAAELVLLAALGLIVIVLVPALQGRWVILVSLLLLGGYAGFSWWSFAANVALIDPTWPILGAVATLMLMSTLNYLREEQQRRRIRSAFGQYVSPQLVERLQDDPARLTLGGERRDLTILFSDVRGFTTIAESFRDDPAGLTQLMNRFLSVQSHAILDEEGTIDKFMGDAVMAFWNAPVDHADHPAAACRAALRMRADVAVLNQRLAEEAAEAGEEALPIDIGVGLNTGSCTVGNMGSDMRFDYTALGDAVNLASRLEGQSKTYGVGIILGSYTAAAVAGEMALIEIDLIRVKGKREPDRIFALLGDGALAAKDPFRQLAAANAAMRTAYAAQDWAEVTARLDEMAGLSATLDLSLAAYIALMRARLRVFAETPPPPGWDGVFDALSK